MDILIVTIFCIVLIGCVANGISVVAALIVGLMLFLFYGKRRGFSASELMGMCRDGISTAANVILMMIIVGMLTAMWRSSGCIPTIVSYASGLIHPSVFVLLAFLLNAVVSVLTGTSVGTAATMGTICMSIANSMGMPPALVGGAVLSGAFFGDRCSPVSTSANLVCTVTQTDIYDNIRRMIRSCVIPLILSCVFYFAAGFFLPGGSIDMDIRSLFGMEFAISPICLIPAVCVLVLAAFKVEIKLTMLISLGLAFAISVFVQHRAVPELVAAMVKGYSSSAAELAPLINGGGLRSMLKIVIIVTIASCYSGIFRKTGLLNFTYGFIGRLAERFGNYIAVLVIGLLTVMIACNQALAIMLTAQLTDKLTLPKEIRANYIEDTTIVIAGIIPWSIACSTPLISSGAPTSSILFACYLYLLPVCGLVRSLINKKS